MTWVAKQNMHIEFIDAEEVCTLKYSIKILKTEAQRWTWINKMMLYKHKDS